jgi:hypothetical protein
MVICGSGLVVAGAIVWGASTIGDAIRESAAARTAAGTASAGGGAQVIEREQKSTSRRIAVADPRDAAEPRAAPEHVRIVVSHDLFERRWKDEGHAAEARSTCWTKVDDAPESVTFRVVINQQGAVEAVQPEELLSHRPDAEPLHQLYGCLESLIETMRFEAGAGADAVVQVNRDW